MKQIKPEKVFAKPNFVHRKSSYIPVESRKNQFVFSGRLDKLKGVDILFEAWKRMRDTAPKLVVCGTGPMEEWCSEFVRKNQVNIELKGFVFKYRDLEVNCKPKHLYYQYNDMKDSQ